MSNTLTDGLRGVAAGVLTPFDPSLDVDHSAIASNVSFLAERGVSTLLAAANISEYHALTHEERIASVETVVDAAPDSTTVLAGVGGATRTALDAAAGAEAAGADAAMVMPPDHTYKHERGLLTYYEKLGAASDLPLVPYVRGFDPSVEFLAGLAALDSVAGIKYAVEDVPKFAAAVAADDSDTVWVDGMAEPYAPSLWLEGAEGFTAGVSNVVPELGLELFDALEDGAWERARALRDLAQPFQDYRGRAGDGQYPGALSVPAVKHAMGLAGMENGDGRVREPIVELSDEEKADVEALYDDVVAGL